MNICLKRTVRVRTLEVAATVAVSRNQPEYLAVAQLAESMGEVDGPLLCRELFGNLRKEIGWKVLEQALYLGLLERTKEKGPVKLSELGKAALKQGQILVPEENIWRFHLVDDPLFEHCLLHVESIAPEDNTREEQTKRGEQTNKGNESSRLRGICGKYRNQIVYSVIDGLAFSLKQIANDGKLGPSKEIELILECNLDNSKRMYLEGTLPNGKTNSSHRIEKGEMSLPSALEPRTYRSLWLELAQQSKGLSGAEKNALNELTETDEPLALHVAFGDRLSEKARKSFQTTITIESPKLSQFGPFQQTRLEQVQLCAATKHDAQAWAEWLFWEELQTYEPLQRMKERWSQKIAPRFKPYSPKFPSVPELEKSIRKNSDHTKRFFFWAPRDLGLER